MSDENTNDVPVTPTEVPPTEISANAEEASLGQRIGATLIDMVIFLPLIIIPLLNLLVFPATFVYLLLRDSLPFLDGQSIGKKMLKLRAVTEDGKPLTGDYSPGVLRNISAAIGILALVELIIMIANKDKPGGIRRLGDQWAKTKVIKVG